MKFQRSKIKVQRGQIVLILVLVTVVGLTVGLSLISRTVTDVRISSQIEQSSRAFSAAEAGVESALKIATGETGTVTLPGMGASADYSVAVIGGGYEPYIFPFTDAATTQTFWLRDHRDDGTIDQDVDANEFPATQSLDICWGSDESNQAALVMTFIYYDQSGGIKGYKIAKFAYDPKADRRADNNFAAPDVVGSGFCGGNFRSKKTIRPADSEFIGVTNIKLIALRLKPVYAGTAIAIQPSGNQKVAVQGKQIISSGQTETGVVRKIQVTQGYNILPSIFDFTLFNWNLSCP